MQKLYLYLASRNKQGIKLVSVLKGDSIVTSRVTDLNRLNLPETWQAKISRIIEDNKMLYEPWIESAGSFNELRERLKTRGYTNVGSSPTPMIQVNETMPKANTSSCQVVKTMTRRKW
jgi:hypothetical protein